MAVPRIPYPPTDGGKIVMFNTIRHLTRLEHEIHVVAFARTDETGAADHLRHECASVATVPFPSGWQPRSLIVDPPATLARYWSAAMQRELAQVALERKIEVVDLETMHMAAYGPSLRPYPRVLRLQNAEYVIWQRYASQHRGAPTRAFLRWQAVRIKRYEARALREFADFTLAVSDADAAALRSIAPLSRIDVLPMGIDTEYFAPMVHVERDVNCIVLTGSFDWAPKLHNLNVIVNDVFPLIRRIAPHAHLCIVGRGLTGRALAEIRSRDGIQVVGPVVDVRPFIARASVVINYVESGSGIAIKVLEAMSMERPIVANPLAVEGIAARDGEHLIVASTHATFARSVRALMSDPALGARLASAARRLAVEKYSAIRLTHELAAYLDVAANSSLRA